MLNIDNTAPTIAYSYSNQTTSDAVPNLAKGGDQIRVIATWDESPLDDNPILTAVFSDLSTAVLTFVSKTNNSEGDDEITYSMTVPDDPLKDGPITFNSASSDAAGNDDFTYENNSLFILDNTAPAITITYPIENESYNDTDLNIFEYLVDELNANASGTVTYTAISGSATDATINLDALRGN